MNERIQSYKDKWKKFLVRGLQNVDFLSHGIGLDVLEELAFSLKHEVVGMGTLLVTAGQEADQIFLVVEGELEVYITNSGNETNLDTVYSGCTIGTYSILNSDLHTISVKAKYDSVVMSLDSEVLRSVREKFPELE